MLESIQPFIDNGWSTIPISSGIQRDVFGKKRFKLPRAWKDILQPNDENAIAGAALVGEAHNLIVIDCDSTETTDIIEKLNPYNDNVAYSLNKKDKDGNIVRGATFFFAYTKGVPQTFNNGPMSLEFFSDGQNRMVFLPTYANESKLPWDDACKLQPMPETLVNLMHIWKQASGTSSSTSDTATVNTQDPSLFKLSPLADETLREPKHFNKEFFKIITPKIYRDKTYTKQGYLSPEDIPRGSGSDYLMRVSSILGFDTSITEEQYRGLMNYIISFFPRERFTKHKKTLELQIVSPMLSGSSSVDGKTIWQYDENWRNQSLTFLSKLNYTIELFYDPDKHFIFEINHSKNSLKSYDSHNKAAPLIAAMTRRRLPQTGTKLLAILPNYESVVEPSKPFGPLDSINYNIFQPSPYLEIMNNPSLHKEDYVKPEEFIEFMESLIPDEADREFLFRHLRTKLTTFKYSPVIYYLVGIPGSGKSLFARLICDIMGESYVSTEMGAEHIVGQFNKWLDSKYFVHFDELYDSLDVRDLSKANGNIKRYTGSETCQIRSMNTNHYAAPMNATFIFTQNGSSLKLDELDRRYLYLDAPNKLDSNLASYLFNQANRDSILRNMCYWIATSFKNLVGSEYTSAPYTESKKELILSKMSTMDRIIALLAGERFIDVYEMAFENDLADDFLSFQDKNFILLDTLIELYHRMVPNHTAELTSNRFKERIKKSSLPPQPRHPYTTIKGDNFRYVKVKNFDSFVVPL